MAGGHRVDGRRIRLRIWIIQLRELSLKGREIEWQPEEQREYLKANRVACWRFILILGSQAVENNKCIRLKGNGEQSYRWRERHHKSRKGEKSREELLIVQSLKSFCRASSLIACSLMTGSKREKCV